ncbi:A.superbus venom factor 1-like [Sceloporus undulatus]|uniref:A.superbus venom factor 1-like n=1 Tax=Sceloporus undulatus TaxID=8520 RepID=UPI001C4AFA16|nr:A.superbus venom factor 1-like [Sceloporus undulatus]
MMEGSLLYLVAALLVCFPTSSHSQLYSMVVPSVLWIESEEQIVVEAHGLTVATEVTVSVHDFPQKKNTLYQIKATLNRENGLMATPSIKVGMGWWLSRVPPSASKEIHLSGRSFLH